MPRIDGPGARFWTGDENDWPALPPIEGEPAPIITRSYDDIRREIGQDVDEDLRRGRR